MKRKNSISEKTLELINRNGVKPIPKWNFVIKNWFLYLLFVTAVSIGGLGFSIMIMMFADDSWQLYQISQQTWIQSLIVNLPYFWIGTTVGFGLFAYIIFRKTKRAYRYAFIRVLATEVLLTLLIGYGMFSFGIGKKVDEIFFENIPLYRIMVPRMIENWSRPESGMLSGIITDIGDKDRIMLTDLDGSKWTIILNNPTIRGGQKIIKGVKIKIIGKMIAEDIFRADEIRPWIGNGMMQRMKSN